MALKAYKEKYGEYPPDFTDLSWPVGPIPRHLARAFPRCAYTSLYPNITNFTTALGNAWGTATISTMSSTATGPSAALAFWLAGKPVLNGTTITGFSGSVPIQPTHWILIALRLAVLRALQEPHRSMNSIPIAFMACGIGQHRSLDRKHQPPPKAAHSCTCELRMASIWSMLQP